MKFLLYTLLTIPMSIFSQEISVEKLDSILKAVPFVGNSVVYEKVFYLDSLNSKEKVFNAAKAMVIKNINYKYSKIDEDRVSGNISTFIEYSLVANTVLGKFPYSIKSKLSIDVKENRFRIRIFDNIATGVLMNTPFQVYLPTQVLYEINKLAIGEFKPKRSIVYGWDKIIRNIIDYFGVMIAEGIKDDDF